jgi:iron-sulfur cluster assembly protein
MQEHQVGCELKITEKAATEFVSMVHQEEKDLEVSYLRVGAKEGGCSGWKYILDYEDTVDSTDLIFEQHGVKMVVDDELLNNVMGDVEVDYKIGDLVEQGFVFNRLKFGHQCGCGESFTPIKDMKNGKEQLGWK